MAAAYGVPLGGAFSPGSNARNVGSAFCAAGAFHRLDCHRRVLDFSSRCAHLFLTGILKSGGDSRLGALAGVVRGWPRSFIYWRWADGTVREVGKAALGRRWD